MSLKTDAYFGQNQWQSHDLLNPFNDFENEITKREEIELEA
jgi:hypothetical protein